MQTLSALARTADLTTKMAAEKVERQLEIVQQQIREQKTQSLQEAQFAKVAQDAIAKRLADAQKAAETLMTVTQQYEAKLAELSTKMGNMEVLLVNQRQKSQRLESELSAAQDRIGGVERRARLLAEENVKIKGEL